MPKIPLMLFLLFASFMQVEIPITHHDVWLEALRVISNIVVLVVAPYIAYKIKTSEDARKETEEARKQQAIKAQAERDAMMSKIDKNTEVTVKAAQTADTIAHATGVDVEKIKMDNSRQFDEWLEQYRTDTHPEKHIKDEEKSKEQGLGTGQDPSL